MRRDKGYSLAIVIILMSVALSSVLAVAAIFLREYRLNTDIKFSTQAFYAAETGVERFAWEYRRNNLVGSGQYSCTSGCLGNNTTYVVTYDFVSSAYVESVGTANQTKRAVRVSF